MAQWLLNIWGRSTCWVVIGNLEQHIWYTFGVSAHFSSVTHRCTLIADIMKKRKELFSSLFKVLVTAWSRHEAFILKRIDFHYCWSVIPSSNITTIFYNQSLSLPLSLPLSLSPLNTALTDLREIYRLFHYRLDTGYISDGLAQPVKQCRVRHATSNVVFLVLTGISWGFSQPVSWGSCNPDAAVQVYTSFASLLWVRVWT